MSAPHIVVAVHDTAPELRALAEGAVMQIACLLHAAGAQVYAPHPASLGDDLRQWPAQLPGTTGVFLGEDEGPDPEPRALFAVGLETRNELWCMRTTLVNGDGVPGSTIWTRGDQDAVLRGIVRTVRALNTCLCLKLPPRVPLLRYLKRQLDAHTTGQAIARLEAIGEALLHEAATRGEGQGVDEPTDTPPAIH